MAIDNVGKFDSQSFNLSDTKGEFKLNHDFDSFFPRIIGNNYNQNGQPSEEMPGYFSNGSINIDSGSGDDQVIINGPVNNPVNVDSGSGDDVVIIGSGHQPGHFSSNPAGHLPGHPTGNPGGHPGGSLLPMPEKGMEGNNRFEPFDRLDTPFSNGPVNVNTGSGDDEVNINGPTNGPVNVETGSGDDRVEIGPSPLPPEPRPAAPVAANETGTIKDDPHFQGGDGGKYDVQGKPDTNYNLLSDEGLELRGRFDAWGENGYTVVGETGLTVGEGMDSDFVNFRKDGSASINGQKMEEGKLYELADGGTAKLENGELSVTTAEGYTVKQNTVDGANGPYINLEVGTGENGVDNGRMPSGLLGQTFDADNEARNGAVGPGAQGEGAITGDVSDYERPALDPINDNRGAEQPNQDSGQEAPIKDIPRPPMETHTDMGSGDDEIQITAGGNHTVELGSGDDEAYVGFEDGTSGNNATIHGGYGDDTVTLKGSQSDYSVSREEGYNVYTDRDGNSVRVADDVENIQFENDDYRVILDPIEFEDAEPIYTL